MKVRVRLSDKDRERYGCPEWLEFDPYAVSIQEAIVLQSGVDIGGVVFAYDTPAGWRNAFNKRENFAVLVAVWLALRGSDVKVPLSDVEFNSDDFDYEVVDEGEAPDPEVGKGGSGPETTSSSASTT